ncbi:MULTISPECIES: hypothetical protein [unclassified Moorena]|uniref:hypothetical protein n=1 Tax=unclassified Moorena TaxID=2683338 RepID=UPI0013BD5DF6|nr:MULTISPECIES: hypothetical protein [unclassified Moorena]NEP30289.1 hypothetical protein [Moorena sp. SIO3B2]NEQ13467.1 hypothetical protein [Moorena sp. SIO3E2]NER91719.1 hypothetical protein [Moorena sp. SIO3A2]NES40351.1 hypothetical protein [Moorena sp. SIO2C4]
MDDNRSSSLTQGLDFTSESIDNSQIVGQAGGNIISVQNSGSGSVEQKIQNSLFSIHIHIGNPINSNARRRVNSKPSGSAVPGWRDVLLEPKAA